MFPEGEEGKHAGKEMQLKMWTSCLDLLSQNQTRSQGPADFPLLFYTFGGLLWIF